MLKFVDLLIITVVSVLLAGFFGYLIKFPLPILEQVYCFQAPCPPFILWGNIALDTAFWFVGVSIVWILAGKLTEK